MQKKQSWNNRCAKMQNININNISIKDWIKKGELFENFDIEMIKND